MELAGIWIGWWGVFLGFVLGMLALDLGVFHKEAHEVKIKEALGWSAFWVALALIFNVILYFSWESLQPKSPLSPSEAGMSFLAGYLVEKALSVDNIFVFLIVFSYFQVPAKYQHRVLFWGIVGALVFRALFIAIGATVLEKWHWMMIVFGLFLIYTGIKMLLVHDKKMDPGKNPLVLAFRRIMPVTSDYHGQKFFTRIDGKLWATPLFVTLLVIEFTDIVFAVDSIPAIFAITKDPFIVFTSNVFAILGLRALFFALAGLMQLFHYLSYGLAIVLMFVGGKMLYGYFIGKFPVGLSLTIILAILALSIVLSLVRPPKKPEQPG
ncbi:MAG: TerC family protein [Fimbriimonadaceae bacterium]|nr:TerC family protein [Fimbriimonadaceae bacterium]QYK58619.1 MAG: TerC family protein [Fimbriimonadaceae bacterium]